MCFGNTTIIMHNTNLNSACCGFPSFEMMSTSFSPGCFGYGFSGGGNMFEMGAGIGLGYAAGMALVPALPDVFKGIGNACSWVWNNALVPAGKVVFNGIKSAVNWVGKGIKNAWNWITGKNK